jgi:hypothetical protein
MQAHQVLQAHKVLKAQQVYQALQGKQGTPAQVELQERTVQLGLLVQQVLVAEMVQLVLRVRMKLVLQVLQVPQVPQDPSNTDLQVLQVLQDAIPKVLTTGVIKVEHKKLL